MAHESILIADDLGDASTQGRLRSRVLRETAIELARSFNFDAEVLYIKDLSAPFFRRKRSELLNERYSAISQSIEDQFHDAGVHGKVEIKAGNPVEEILTEAEIAPQLEMIAIGTQGKTGLEKMLLGSVAEEVLRNATVPVMVVGPAAQNKDMHFKADREAKILFLTDLTDSSLPAEKFTQRFGQKLQCQVTVMHCLGDQIRRTRDSLYGSGYLPFDMDKMFDDMTAEADRYLARHIRQWRREGIDASAVLVLKEEDIEKSFLDQIHKGYTLVVMGTHGRNKLMTAFLGSTTRKILLTSPVPVIVCRQENHEDIR